MKSHDQLLLLNIDLHSFDGEGGGGATGGTGGVAPTQTAGTSAPQGAPATAPKPQEIVYGKQDATSDGQATHQVDVGTTPDPSQEFESLIKGQYKEQFDARIQQIIDKRFKGVKETETRLNELSPIVDLLSEKYGAKDINDLRAKMESEVLEELAYKNNMDVDTYKQFRENQLKAQMYEQHVRSQEWQQQVDQKVAGWYQQAEAMKSDYPDFDFKSYVNENPQFLELLQSGVPVKTAYEVFNIDTIKSNTVKQAQEAAVKSIQANGARPREAAASNSNSPVIKSDVRSLTKQDREEIARRAQRGETIRF